MQFNLDLWPLVGGRTVRAIIYVPPEKFSSLQWPLRGHCKLETNRTNRGGQSEKHCSRGRVEWERSNTLSLVLAYKALFILSTVVFIQ